VQRRPFLRRRSSAFDDVSKKAKILSATTGGSPAADSANGPLLLEKTEMSSNAASKAYRAVSPIQAPYFEKKSRPDSAFQKRSAQRQNIQHRSHLRKLYCWDRIHSYPNNTIQINIVMLRRTVSWAQDFSLTKLLFSLLCYQKVPILFSRYRGSGRWTAARCRQSDL
jgi:predicted acyl esterase